MLSSRRTRLAKTANLPGGPPLKRADCLMHRNRRQGIDIGGATGCVTGAQRECQFATGCATISSDPDEA
jgi:hypothetical protein